MIAKAAFLGGLGSYFEYYDFFIALLATSIAWPAVFFAGMSATVGVALSILSYSLTFFTRPVGAYIFGHYGDRIGRKYVLFLTLLIMGIGSFAIAALPGSAAWGAAAPILLSLIRLAQGIGLGGEAGGASTWVLELASKSKHRGFWTSWVQAGSPAGLFTAAALTTFMLDFTGHTAYLAWGWRIPFVIGGVVAVVGGILRYMLIESPLFTKLHSERKIEKYPASQVLKKQWKKVLILLSAAFPEVIGTSVMVVPFSIVYMIQLHVPAGIASGASIYLALGAFVATVIVGILCDYVGRKIFFILAALFSALLAYPYFLVIGTANVSYIIPMLFIWGFVAYTENGVLPPMYAESFETKWRYSGASLSMQLGIFITGTVIGFVLPAVLASSALYANLWPSVAGIMIVMSIVALLTSLLMKETKDINVDY